MKTCKYIFIMIVLTGFHVHLATNPKEEIFVMVIFIEGYHSIFTTSASGKKVIGFITCHSSHKPSKIFCI